MKWLTKIADAVMALTGLGLFAIWLPGMMLWKRHIHRRRRSSAAPEVLLTIMSGSHRMDAKRNIGRIYEAILTRGYFDKVLFLHFLADEWLEEHISQKIWVCDFRARHARHLEVHFPLCARLLQEWAFLNYTLRLIAREKVTLIQANDPYIQGLNALIVAKSCHLPFYINIMSDYDHFYTQFGKLAFPVLKFRLVEKALERLVYHFADGVRSWNQYYASCAQRNGCRAEKITVIPNEMDPYYLEDPSDADLPRLLLPRDAKDVLIYLGRLSWQKYSLDLADCMKWLIQQNPNARLVILGGGDQRAEFEERCAKLKVSEHILLPGPQSVAQIIAWARLARVMLATHAGFALAEMGAVGIPVVAYQYEWHPEVVRNKETGFLVPFRDAKAMAEKAVEIMRDASLGEKMRVNIRAAVRSKWHPDQVAEEKIRFYKSLRRKV